MQDVRGRRQVEEKILAAKRQVAFEQALAVWMPNLGLGVTIRRLLGHAAGITTPRYETGRAPAVRHGRGVCREARPGIGKGVAGRRPPSRGDRAVRPHSAAGKRLGRRDRERLADRSVGRWGRRFQEHQLQGESRQGAVGRRHLISRTRDRVGRRRGEERLRAFDRWPRSGTWIRVELRRRLRDSAAFQFATKARNRRFRGASFRRRRTRIDGRRFRRAGRGTFVQALIRSRGVDRNSPLPWGGRTVRGVKRRKAGQGKKQGEPQGHPDGHKFGARRSAGDGPAGGRLW